jgi:nucleoside-diphosphate-sugar epimerase
VDLEDVVSAHLLALERAPSIGFGRYIITATTPFLPEDLRDLRVNAPLVVKRRASDHQFKTVLDVFQRLARLFLDPAHDFAFSRPAPV